MWNSKSSVVVACFLPGRAKDLSAPLYRQKRVTRWPFCGWNPGWGKVFLSRPGRPWGSPFFLYNWYWISLPGIKWPRRDIVHLHPSSEKVWRTNRAISNSPSGSSWPVQGGPYLYLYLLISVYFTDRTGQAISSKVLTLVTSQIHSLVPAAYVPQIRCPYTSWCLTEPNLESIVS